MPIEASADARKSRRHAAGVDHAGRAADDRGYLAAAASRFSLWWHGDRRPPALTADTASGAGLQGGNDDAVPSSDGGASTASPEGGSSPTTSDRVCRREMSPKGKNVRALIHTGIPCKGAQSYEKILAVFFRILARFSVYSGFCC